MTAAAPYMPDDQVKFDLWLKNFSTHITAAPAQYGLSQADAATIAEIYAEWSAAYRPVTTNWEKTKATVAAKNAAREMAEGSIRPCAQIIANDDTVSVADKIALGLNPRNNRRSAIQAPSTCPVLHVKSAAHLSLTLTYENSGAGLPKRARPPGVTHCQIFAASSATPITAPTQLPLRVLATKSPFQLQFDSREANQTC